MIITELFIDPFIEYAFMKRALAASLILALGGAPLGVFMSLRRMTLVGDALGHAILPGIALSFILAGFSVWAMTLGGVAAAVVVGAVAVLLTRFTRIKEDAAFTLVYLISLAGGVTLVSLKGSQFDVMDLLFGNVLGIEGNGLVLMACATTASLVVLAVLYRRLVVEGVDPDFLRVAAARRTMTGWTHPVFFLLLLINLVAAFQVLGTLMSLGLMILPAIAARFWLRNVDKLMAMSLGLACFSAYAGLLLSYHAHLPAGPSIVLVAGGTALLSALVGRVGSVRTYFASGA